MNFYKISLPDWDYPIRDDIVIADYFGITPGLTRYPTDILSPALLDDICRRGLHIKEVQVFISPGPHTMIIHIDGTVVNNNHCAVNWIVSPSPAWSMSWYEYNGPEVSNKANTAGTTYLELAPADCTAIETQYWTGPALVNVGIPHRIVNLSQTLRYCVSLRFMNGDGTDHFDVVKAALI